MIDLTDSASFFNQQIRQEKAWEEKLKLKEDIQERLQARHSLSAISRFFSQHGDIIKRQHFLYEVNGLSTPLPNATIRFQWLPNVDNRVYSLDSYNYCLFTREQYTTATTNGGVSKGSSLSLSLSRRSNSYLDSFYDIRRKQKKISSTPQKTGKYQQPQHQKKKKQPQTPIVYKRMCSLSLSLLFIPLWPSTNFFDRYRCIWPRFRR